MVSADRFSVGSLRNPELHSPFELKQKVEYLQCVESLQSDSLNFFSANAITALPFKAAGQRVDTKYLLDFAPLADK